MQILIDTNVILRFVEPADPLHSVTLTALDSLRHQGHQLVIVPQIIYEFWAVATRTIEANGLGKQIDHAQQCIQHFEALFILLKDERSIYEKWMSLVSRHEVKGINSYDTRIVAAMLHHQVTHILTFNPKDFRRYSQITILDPKTVTTLPFIEPKPK